MLTYFLFVIGFVILIKGADWLVDGASSVAKKFGISTLVIGLTVVAFGTSAPELIVNILASINGNSDIAIGNILGSNICNILLILGIAAIIYPLTVKRGTVWKEIPLALLAVIAVALMANDIFIEGGGWSGLTRIDGLILLAFFLIFLYYVFEISKTGQSNDTKIKNYSLLISLSMIAGGLVSLTLGGKWVVDGAVAIAQTFNISEALIGLTIVAIGTSLPELATSAVAAYKHNSDIAVGNIVGSNIFNIFWILGLSAVIRPLPFSEALNTDVLVTMIATILLFMVMFVGKKHTLERWQGVTFVIIYIIYIVYLIYRG
ncbi:MAG: calcium/sodium antiporter [Patescibacteria group bacterium]